MKTIIAAFFLFSNLALANNYQNDNTEISYTVLQLASIDANIASIRLNDSGVMTVTKHDRAFKTVKLTEKNKEDFFWLAQMLVEADLETENRTAVCEILLPAHAIQNLQVFDANEGVMKLVLSSSSCALPSYTHPKEEQLTKAALFLKAKLIVLAQQLIN